ncbi:isocitrate/isopropylmalate dehydrogenase family protein [Chloroflexota bacterium]
MRILVLPCDGIGPEITEAAMSVLDAVSKVFDLRLTYDYDDVGFVSLKKFGTTLRDEVLERANTYDGIILGPESQMDYISIEKGGINVSAAFRVGLDLYANVRPARSRPFLGKGVSNMDIVIMREATEGFYPDRNMFMGCGEMMPTPDMALSIRKITAHGSERIARRAFELAMKRRKKVTTVHKVSCFKLTDGLFLEEARKVAKEFPEVELEEVLVDAMAAHLVRDASIFDVILASNFYGDILSDLASELSGGIGLAGAIMASDTLCCAQAQHGSAPDIQGRDIANPTSMILSVAMMLQWIGENQNNNTLSRAGNAMEAAVDGILADPATRTVDIGGSLGCKEFGQRVADAIHTT